MPEPGELFFPDDTFHVETKVKDDGKTIEFKFNTYTLSFELTPIDALRLANQMIGEVIEAYSKSGGAGIEQDV